MTKLTNAIEKINLINQLEEAAKTLKEDFNVCNVLEVGADLLRELTWHLELDHVPTHVYLRSDEPKSQRGEHLLALIKLNQPCISFEKLNNSLEEVRIVPAIPQGITIYSPAWRSKLETFWKAIEALGPLEISNKQEALDYLATMSAELEQRRDCYSFLRTKINSSWSDTGAKARLVWK